MADPNIFKKLIHDTAAVRTKSDLVSLALTNARTCFGSSRVSICLCDSTPDPVEIGTWGGRDKETDDYLTTWRSMDTILARMCNDYRPVHNRMLFPSDAAWHKELIYREFARQLAVEHYMAIPVFAPAGIVGALHVSRGAQDRPFDSKDTECAAIFSGIISMNLATLPRVGATPSFLLTRRELQIARLVASGCNNLEVARRLGLARETVKQTLRRVYGKVEVRGRAEMAAQLAHLGLV